MAQHNYTDEKATLVFREKSRDYPGGRIALLADGKVIFPEVRFHPQVGKKYPCTVRFYEKWNKKSEQTTVTGIAFPENPSALSDEEYLHDTQLVISVTFVRERAGSAPVARHPITGAYIVPTEGAMSLITIGTPCWVMLVQRGTSLVAHFIKNVEGSEIAPPPVKALAQRDATFAAKAEESLLEKGMGAPPVFKFQGKMQFPWEILGVGRDASLEAIRKAFRDLSMVLHPDKKPGGEEDFIALAHAGDWQTFRRLWADGVTARKKKPTRLRKKPADATAEPQKGSTPSKSGGTPKSAPPAPETSAGGNGKDVELKSLGQVADCANMSPQTKAVLEAKANKSQPASANLTA